MQGQRRKIVARPLPFREPGAHRRPSTAEWVFKKHGHALTTTTGAIERQADSMPMRERVAEAVLHAFAAGVDPIRVEIY